MGDGKKGPPFGSFRPLEQFHPGFTRRTIAFERVALNARANNIFPCCRTTAITGNDMIQIQIPAIHHFPAVLALMFVALENIVAGEFHFLARHPVKKNKENHFGYLDAKCNCLDHPG